MKFWVQLATILFLVLTAFALVGVGKAVVEYLNVLTEAVR